MNDNTRTRLFRLQEVLQFLHTNVLISSCASAIWSSALFLYFDGQTNTNQRLIWWLAMMVILLLRLLDVIWYKKNHRLSHINPEKELRRFSFFCIGIAGLWGFYPILVFPFPSIIELSLVIVTICGITSGIANIWSAHKFTGMFSVLLILSPLAILLLISSDFHYRLLGIAVLIYTFLMYSSASKMSSFTYKVIDLKYENTQLLKHMEEKVEVRTQEIYKLSNIDSLTGLLNRNAFIKELNKAIAEKSSTPFALLFIDLDGFKQINDSLGHKIGDKVIKETSSRISLLCEESLPPCRWGGDEFLIIYKSENIEDINNFSSRVIDLISRPHYISQSKTWVSATIGVALYPQHSSNYDELIQNADIAMYHQKRLEKGKVGHFDKSLSLKIARERMISDQLVLGIQENNFRLVFQPITDSETEKTIGLEALIRWQFNGKDISPVEFIPIAEQCGMIKAVGMWVVEQACQQIILLSKEGKKLTVSINVSIVQLQDTDFTLHVKELLTRLSFDPTLLHIEITESFFATDKAILMTQITALQKMGLKIAIDDFGTGYSSLSSMQDLGVDIVKIDKSFIDKISGSGLPIINAVVQISESLNYKVVAEGVESAEQVKTLQQIGVHFLQGYYFSKPLEVNQLTDYLNHHL